MSLIITSSNSKGYDGSSDQFDADGNIIFNLQKYPLGVENPASYHNFFNAPLKIKQNSEIAVQSVKFTRPNRTDIKEGRYKYYMYLGKPVDAGVPIENSVNLPMVAEIPEGTYTEAGLADALQTSMNRFIYHPSAAGLGLCTTLSNATSSAFDGFQWKFQGYNKNNNSNTRATLPNSILPVADGSTGRWEDSSSISFDNTTWIIEKTNDDAESVGILGCAGVGENSQCLSPDGGEMVIEIPDNVDGATGKWGCGLTRPTRTQDYISYFEEQSTTDYFCDYQVDKTLGNVIRVRQNMKVVGSDTFKAEQVFYWSATNGLGYSWTNDADPAGSIYAYGCHEQIDMSVDVVKSGPQAVSGADVVTNFTYKILTLGDTNWEGMGAVAPVIVGSIFRKTAVLPTGAAHGTADTVVETDLLTHIRFTYKNDYLTIEMGPTEFRQGETVILCDTGFGATAWAPGDANHDSSKWVLPDRTSKNKYLRPVNQCCWNLVPWFRLYTVGVAGHMELDLFQGRTVPLESDEDYYTGSWWGSPLINQMEQGLLLDVGRLQQSDPTYAGAVNILPYYTFLGMPVLDATQYQDAMSTFDMAMIVNTGSNGVVKYTDVASNANVGHLFGFPNFTYVDQTNLSTPAYQFLANDNAGDPVYSYKIFQSTNIPVLATGQSCFIRSPTFTHQSQNGANSGMSKILYHLPRFSDTGNDVGALYWTPTEMVYVDLNNPSEMTLNDIHVDIVDVDEKIINDLDGNTIVVFHIREKK